MKRRIGKLIFTLILLFPFFNTYAQVSQPYTIHASFTSQPIKLDGHLSEPVWRQARHISNFTQRELNEGQPASERTQVAVAFDKNNLYIAVWCFDREPDKLIAEKMKRDFDFDSEDNFEIIIDSYHDKRNGYLFVTNPNGARFDALIQNNGDRSNESWNGVWNVKTQINKDGWFAEFGIPFSTLKFSTGSEQLWGINFERNIRRKREQVLWQGWSRDSEIEQVNRAGLLSGIEGVNNVRLIEFKPFGIAGTEKNESGRLQSQINAGGDLNYLITPTMKLNITVNTDFAQVESDRMQINLSRFSLYYPEKRDFFLEGRNYFDFGLGHRTRPFYSRRIGLTDEGRQIPIIAGARLLGKVGGATLGTMSIQTAAKDSLPSSNYSVVRWKQDVFKQSTIGLIGVSKHEARRQNAVYGADFLYSTSEFLGDKNFYLGGALAQSYTSDETHKKGLAHRLFVDFPNDLVDFSAVWNRSDKDFRAESGYQRRSNYQMINADLRIKPRPSFLPWMQRLNFKPFDFNYYFDDDSHEMQSLWSEFRLLGFTTRRGEFFEGNIQRLAENLKEDFEIHDGVTIPKGEYWFTRYELQFSNFSGQRVHYFIFLNWGKFYSGQRTEWAVHDVFRINKHVSFNGGYTQNIILLPQGNFVTNEISGKLDVALNPDMFGSLFGQWNNDENQFLLNLRFNWIPTPGTNFYFVIDQALDQKNGSWVGTNTTVLTKLVWRFVL